MKMTLSEQVQAYIDHRGEGYTPAMLAAQVANLQTDLPPEARCKRQNIEGLLKNPLQRTVRYLPELAAAMGTTAEVLASGTYRPLQPIGTAEPSPPQYRPPSIAVALRMLRAELDGLAPTVVRAAEDIVIKFVRREASLDEAIDTLMGLASVPHTKEKTG